MCVPSHSTRPGQRPPTPSCLAMHHSPTATSSPRCAASPAWSLPFELDQQKNADLDLSDKTQKRKIAADEGYPLQRVEETQQAMTPADAIVPAEVAPRQERPS